MSTLSALTQKVFVGLQYALPKQCLSRAVGWLADNDMPWLKNFLIRRFIDHFNVDMSEAAQPDYTLYRNFNSFFTRPLAEGLRPICKEAVASPADGSVSQIGSVAAGRIFQAKGQAYTTLELLGGDHQLAQLFDDGLFATIYLAPRNYHRVHMPVAGKLRRSIYVPGDLFSVNAVTTENVPRLFARNERLVSIFETEYGEMALVLVGAMIVAGIDTVWSGRVTPRLRRIEDADYSEPTPVIELAKAAEMGRFILGSTVVVLFRNSSGLAWKRQAGDVLRMGEALADVSSAPSKAEGAAVPIID